MKRLAWLTIAPLVFAGACGVQEHPRGPLSSVSSTSGGSGDNSPGEGSGGRQGPSGGGAGAGGSVGPSGSSGASGSSGGGGDGARPAPPPVGDGGTPASTDGRLPDTSAPPASGITIDINGTKVPKEKAIAFIFLGHSNMAGRATVPSTERPFFYTPQPRLWVYNNNTFVAAKEPTIPDNSTSQGAGPGMAVLRLASEAAPPDYHFIALGVAKGSATSADFLKGALYYSGYVDKARTLKGRVTFGGFVVMMGVTERHLPIPDQSGFPMRMQQIIDGLRAELAEPNLPVLHCDYEVEATGELSLSSDFAKRIRPLILSLPTKISNLVIVPTDKIAMQDDHHFNMLGHHTWAGRVITLLKDKGWAPWMK